MVIHYVSVMFEVLVEIQLGRERQGQIVIIRMEGEIRRTSVRQTQRDQIKKRLEGDMSTGEKQPEKYSQRKWNKLDDIWANDRESVICFPMFLIPADKHPACPCPNGEWLSSDNASQSFSITPSKSIITEPKHMFAIQKLGYSPVSQFSTVCFATTGMAAYSF